jgi:hypothetical protein
MATVTLRLQKAAPLTNAELDDNFVQLNVKKIELGGDIGGSTSTPFVISLQGRPISTQLPTIGQTLVWNGSAWTPATPTGGGGTGTTVSVTALDPITGQFDAIKQTFTLKNNRIGIIETTEYGDNKDFLVVVNGRVYDPLVPQLTTGTLGVESPWFTEFSAGQRYSYRVKGSTLTLFTQPRPGETGSIRINSVSSTRQKQSRYPITPNTIAFGD